MAEKRIKFNNVIQNQVPSYVKEEFPLILDFLKQYYISQEFQGSAVDLIQNIDSYIKLDEIKSSPDFCTLTSDITFLSTEIPVSTTIGFPDSYGLIQIDNEVITYTGKTLNSFIGCIRGFSGITSYNLDNSGELVFETSKSNDHFSTDENGDSKKVVNLSSLFLKQFFNKIKYQLTPGFENREFYEGLDKNLFLKQAKDFYSTRGTDRSFQILFKVLYGEDVKVIKPQEYLIKPSDSQYIITNDLVVESISGDPYELVNSTLFQDEYEGLSSKGYAPISNVEKIFDQFERKYYYKLSFDAGYNKDINVDGSLYGNFSIHPKTKVIGDISFGSDTIDVDSTVGFPSKGELTVKYSDESYGTISYTSKNLNQFFGCQNIDNIISDKSDIWLNTYAYGTSNKNQNEIIKVRITSVLKDIDLKGNTYYQKRSTKGIIKTLGNNTKNNNLDSWILNIPLIFDVSSLVLIDNTDKTYRLFTKTEHNLKNGDKIKIISSDGVEKNSTVIKVLSNKSIEIRNQGILNINQSHKIKRILSKVESVKYSSLSNQITDIQNVYINGDKNLVAASSLPFYDKEPLNPSDRSVIFSGTFVGDTFNISNHGFYTGDVVYYTSSVGSLFEDGVYYIKKITSDTIKISKSRSNLYNSIFLNIENPINVTNSKFQEYNLHNKNLNSQKILREIIPPINEGKKYDTNSGITGILINGVEILNYKSNDKIYYGSIEKIEVINPGNDYDVINPPELEIIDSVGYGATGYCSVKGSLQEIRIIDPGFDYLDIPKVNITGGNGSGAKANPSMKLIDHEIIFNSQQESAIVNITTNSIGFSTYHKFRNAEKVIYKTQGQKGVGGLSTNASYYVSTNNAYTVKLHKTFQDAVSGINTISLTSYGIGNHILQSTNKKSIIASITIENSGSDYENKKRSTKPSGISTSLSYINIADHDFKSGEIINYTTTGTSIGGLLNNTNYYVTTIDENNFKLSLVGVTTDNKDFYYKTNQYIDFTSSGSGIHIFNYPQISVEIDGNVGISSVNGNTFKAIVQPIFRGEITSVYLEESGFNYGSEEVINFDRSPLINLLSGANAQATPIISNGKIVDILINNSGSDYNSPPNVRIFSNNNIVGSGAVITPLLENNQIKSFKINEGGFGYDQKSTFISISPSGIGAQFKVRLKSWTVNLFKKYFNSFTDDDGFIFNNPNTKYDLQYTHLYSPRKLRENIFSKNLLGESLYGKPDLKKQNGSEISSNDHSPIIGWAYDGNPIYGPYGFSKKDGGLVTQMKSGYKEVIKENRPSQSSFPIGFFVEDYEYKNVDDDDILDECNGRFCVTPEFPNGTYAYFATVSENSSTSQSDTFYGYKTPVFPYLIGNKFNSLPNEFNFKQSSNQDQIDLNETEWVRGTFLYNLNKDQINYEYLNLPNYLNQEVDIKFSSYGSIESVGIITGGLNYKVNDSIFFDDSGTEGFGFSSKVSRIFGKSINNVSLSSTIFYNANIYPLDKNKGSFVVELNSPHGLFNKDVVTLSGLNTTSSIVEKFYSIDVNTNRISISNPSGIGTVGATGIVTYISVSGNLDYINIKENDILLIDNEKLKVLNIDQKLSRIRVLREFDGTVGTSHSYSDILYEMPKRFLVNLGNSNIFEYSDRLNKEIYFDPKESLGVGNSSGVGIGTTIYFSNPGVGITQVFIPTKSIYLPNHNLFTGDSLVYSTNGGGGIIVSSNGISTQTLQDQSLVYVSKISKDLIGISTVKVGLSSTGVFVGIASTTSNIGTLYFVGVGTGSYHSFETTYPKLTGQVLKNTVTVSTSQTHGLTNNDIVYVNVNPGIVTTFTFKYNDYNRKVLINPRSFNSADINVLENSIYIPNHKFINGQKVIYNSTSPSGGLFDNKIYYVTIFDENTVKLSSSYYSSISSNPNIVNITSTSNGTLSPVNPPINVYKDSTITFDLSDSSLSYTNQSVQYSAFELNFYLDSNFNQIFDSSGKNTYFEVKKYGKVGVDSDARVVLTVNKDTPIKLFYKLDPIYSNILPKEKEEVNIDSSVFSNNQILVKNSEFNGKHTVTSVSSTSFSYIIPKVAESYFYESKNSTLEYETTSLSAYGSISKVDVISKGQNYYSLPYFSGVKSTFGTGAILESFGKTIGNPQKFKIKDIGFEFPTDFTVKPNLSLPQILKIESLNSFESIGITSVGRGYSSTPKLIVLDGKTKQIISEVDLRYSTGDTKVTILNNTYRLNKVEPIIIPTENSNGVGISSIKYNPITKDVSVKLSVGFSTIGSFPFSVNDKILIENVSVGIGSTGKGFNSQNYNYELFTITSVDENIGGIGTITYSLSNYLSLGEFPGNYDPENSSGRIIPEKYFPKFSSILKPNNFLKNEKIVYSDDRSNSIGSIENWDGKNSYLSVSSKESLEKGRTIEGSSSKTQGIVLEVIDSESFINLGAYSKVEYGWITETGFLNSNIQRIQDNFYYQNFSYSLKSKVPYDTWENAVGSLNHTVGFKKFSDYQCEPSLSEVNSNRISLGSTSSIDIVTDIYGVGNLNCVYDFDLARENALNIGSKIISDEITFSNRILQDYFESIGNRVLSIDDISYLFNSNPRLTKFSEVNRFLLSDYRAQKYITYVKDRRYTSQRQLMLFTLLHDNSTGYLNQYGRVETSYDLGSFDFFVEGSEGVILFYPTKYSVNDYNVVTLSCNLRDSFSGIGSTNIGGIVNVNTNTVFVSSGSTTIVGLGSTYRSAKVLLEINGNNGEYQFEELNFIHDGSNIEFINYGQLTNHSTDAYGSIGLGTYYPYFSGSNLNIDFTPNVGVAASISILQISIGNTFSSGIGTFDIKYARFEARTLGISSSPSPSQNIVAEYPNDYDGGYFIAQVSDITNNRHQLSEIIVVDDENDSFITEYANLETHVGLGTFGTIKTTNSTQLVFTPIANINAQVKVYFNSLRDNDEDKTIVSYHKNTFETDYGIYYGTERDIKRSFNLTHKNYPIFERKFNGSDPLIVNVNKNTITIPNHFFVSGENVTYSSGSELETNSPLGITTTDFGVGIGTTNKLPSSVYIIKIDENNIKFAKNAQDALRNTPLPLDITSVGIGSNHYIISKNQNAKVLVSIDNAIQSPIVSTSSTTTLSKSVLSSEDIIYVNKETNFFGGDLIKIDDEIMKVTSVGLGSTNAISVLRPWLGTEVVGHSTDSKVTKIVGNYNIVNNTINFVSAPYGNIPLSTTSNPPDERDWTGITTGSSFHGRTFMRSGVRETSNESYYKNYVFDDISSQFNGIKKDFTLLSQENNVSDIYFENGIILINDIFQGPGLTNNYILSESTGITSISFIGTGLSITSDIKTSNLPAGGRIVSVGSTSGLGYQPLVSAGGTVVVSYAGTIQSVSVGNTGSGYRGSLSYEILTDTSSIISVGSTQVYIKNVNSVFEILNLLNIGTNCTIGIGTFISSTQIVSLGSTFVCIGIGSTSAYQIPSEVQCKIKINNPHIGIVNVGIATSSVGISTVTHIGFSTIISGNISTNVKITNPGYGYTSLNLPKVIFDSPLSYSDIPLIYTSSSTGIGTQATIDIVVGQGSSVIDFEIKNTGYGYQSGETLTVPTGGVVGIPLVPGITGNQFNINIQKTFSDKFTGWSIGELQPFDAISDLFNGTRIIFPLKYLGELVSIQSSKGSNINLQDILIVFINDILQVPGEGYIFNGGSLIEFTEPPKLDDTCKILLYKGTGDVDVVFKNILETVKVGDDVTLTYDPSRGQSPTLLENPRTVLEVKSTNLIDTNPYFGPGNTSIPTLTRPLIWCKQTEDKIINEKEIGKDRTLYEPSIYPTTYLIKSVGIGSTIAFVESIRPFFNPINENNTTLRFQKYVNIISQDPKVSASATAVVSSGGTISSIIISNGGIGYGTSPIISIAGPIGFGTTTTQNTAKAVSTISGGIVTGIAVTVDGFGYTSAEPPLVLIEPPTLTTEQNEIISYEGDFGIITGISTISVGVASTGLVFDFLIPKDSYLRNSSITGLTTISGSTSSGLTTVSGIQTGYYFVISNSNVGNGLISIDSSGSIISIGNSFIDSVYQVASVSIAQTMTVGLGLTYVAKVVVRVSDYNGLSGIGYSNYYGNYSWGKVTFKSRQKENEYNSYTLNGYSGLSTGSILTRSNPLKYLNYIS